MAVEDKLFELCQEKQERVELLEQLMKHAVKLMRQNCFIIPKDGERRDRAISLLENMKEVLGLKGSNEEEGGGE